MRKVTINKNDAGQRLDKFMHKFFKSRLPSALIYKYIRIKRVKVNGKRCTPQYMLQQGDALELYLNDEMFDDGKSVNIKTLRHIAPDFTIAYQDQNILVVDKKAGVTVHHDDDGTVNTLITQIIRYLADKGEYVPENEHSFVPALCNRLDRNTSGLVIAAKNAAALREMNYIIRHRLVRKFYYVKVAGIMPCKSDTLHGFLVKDERENKVKIYEKAVGGAVPIVTKYTVIKTYDNSSLLEVELVTGKTHQIRAHLSYIGHPVLGDGKYGNAPRGLPLMLHSNKLIFLPNNQCNLLKYLGNTEIISNKCKFINTQ